MGVKLKKLIETKSIPLSEIKGVVTLKADIREYVDDRYSELVSKSIKCIKSPTYTEKFRIFHAFYRNPMNNTIEI